MRNFAYDQRFVIERPPVIGDTVLIPWGINLNRKPSLGIYIGDGIDYKKIWTPDRIVTWEHTATLYVIDKTKL